MVVINKTSWGRPVVVYTVEIWQGLGYGKYTFVLSALGGAHAEHWTLTLDANFGGLRFKVMVPQEGSLMEFNLCVDRKRWNALEVSGAFYLNLIDPVLMAERRLLRHGVTILMHNFGCRCPCPESK